MNYQKLMLVGLSFFVLLGAIGCEDRKPENAAGDRSAASPDDRSGVQTSNDADLPAPANPTAVATIKGEAAATPDNLKSAATSNDRKPDSSQLSDPPGVASQSETPPTPSAANQPARDGQTKAAAATLDVPIKDANDPRFHEPLLEVVDEYLQYALINPTPNLAPELCKAPAGLTPPAPRMSKADSSSSHGQKLYFLFAKQVSAYFDVAQGTSPTGQVLVKESWSAKPGNPEARNLRNHASANRINPRIRIDGKTLEIGKRNDLFIMLKLEPDTEGTDDGWVYGVVDREQRRVKAAGKVASCMKCHVGQPDRLFRVDQNLIISETTMDPVESSNESIRTDQPKTDRSKATDDSTKPSDTESEKGSE